MLCLQLEKSLARARIPAQSAVQKLFWMTIQTHYRHALNVMERTTDRKQQPPFEGAISYLLGSATPSSP